LVELTANSRVTLAYSQMVVLLDPEEDHDNVLRANRSRERKYIFDVVSDARAGQEDVYAATAKTLLSSVLEGYNATVFAYGATGTCAWCGERLSDTSVLVGAGKTYTMLGTENNPGVMYRTLHDLFVEIQQFKGERDYQVSMSYLEVYNELIRDLLTPSSSTFLELREDAKGTIQVAGLSEMIAKTPEEVMDMLHKGNRARTQEPTKANRTSSRSHAVLQVNIKQRDVTRSHTEQVRFGRREISRQESITVREILAKLYMIDLAGSERAAHTQNTGRRMVEGMSEAPQRRTITMDRSRFLSTPFCGRPSFTGTNHYGVFRCRCSYQSIVTRPGQLHQCLE
jgi:kinesin family member 18/19